MNHRNVRASGTFSSSEVAALTQPVKPLNLLFIGGSPVDFQLVERQLQEDHLAATFQRVTMREELLAALKGAEWDAVLSDYHVPALALEETLRILQPRLEELPLILVSGSIGEERTVDLLRQGVWDLVLKDNLSRLTPAIRRSLRDAADRRARRQAETALREKADKFRQLTENITDVFWVTSLHMNVIHYVSPAFERVWGRPVASAYENPRQRLEAVVPEDRDRVAAAFNVLAKGQAEIRIEYQIALPNGSIRWILDRGFHVRDAAGTLVSLAGVAKDVTAQKQAELRLQHEEAALRGILNATLESVCLFDRNGSILMANHTAVRRFGKTHHEVVGHHFSEIMPPNLAQARMARFQEVLKSGQTVEFEDERAGMLFQHFLYPMADDSGQVTRVVCFSRDISERKRAEKRFAELNQCLVSFGADAHDNIDRLVAFLGEQFSATCALYNRLEGSRLHAVGRWHAPPDFCPLDTADGHICLDVIRADDSQPRVLRDLPASPYAQTDPNVLRYGLKTYLGKRVTVDGLPVGSLCLVFQTDRSPTPAELDLLGIVASAVAVEEKRLRAESALRESERFRQTIMDLVPHFIFVKDSQSRHLFVNRACAAANGMTPEQMIGKSDADFLPNRAQAEKFMHDDLEVINSGKSKFIPEERLVDSTGCLRLLQTLKIPFVAPTGQPALMAVAVDVTGLKRAEAALRESEARYRNLFESSREAILTVDPVTGKYTSGNPAALKMLGVQTEAELRTRGPADFSPREQPNGRPSAETVRAINASVVREGSLAFEWNHRRLDGRDFFADVMLTRIELDDQPAILATVRDITERKQAESALRHSEEEFRAMFEVASIGMGQGDPATGQFVRVNRKLCEITGYSPEELTRMKVRDVTHPEDRERDWALYHRVVLGQAPHYQIEKRYLRKDGAIVWVNVNMTVIRDTSGRPLHTMATIEDITERRQAGNTLRLQAAALAAAANAIVITDRQGRIQWVNQAFTSFTGYAIGEVVGKTPRLLKSGEHEPAFYENLWQTILAGKIWHGEMVNRRKDGSPLSEEMTITPVRDARGDIAHFIAIKQDITARKRLESLFQQAQKMQAIGQLAGGVAHDFNNILTSILMQVELASMENNLPDEIRESLKQIQADAQRAANLTRQLLLFSRRQVMQPRNLDVNEIVAHLAKMLRRIIGEDVKLDLNLYPAPLWTRADAGMLEQVLMNLAVNARDAMAHGGDLAITTTETTLDENAAAKYPDVTPGRYVGFRVSDTGCGIPADVLPRIFEPFFTTKAPGKGTGLGLATVFGIVNQHRGWIAVDSTPGAGSTFQVFVPAGAAPSATLNESSNAKSRGGSETILLVEDEPAVREMTRTVLVRNGYQVREAANGAEALKVWAGSPDSAALLLTDLVMPAGMSGLQLARQLQADKPGLKVVYVSGYSAEIAGREIELRPGENFLQKPFTVEDLLRAIRTSLNSYSQETSQ